MLKVFGFLLSVMMCTQVVAKSNFIHPSETGYTAKHHAIAMGIATAISALGAFGCVCSLEWEAKSSHLLSNAVFLVLAGFFARAAYDAGYACSQALEDESYDA